MERSRPQICSCFELRLPCLAVGDAGWVIRPLTVCLLAYQIRLKGFLAQGFCLWGPGDDWSVLSNLSSQPSGGPCAEDTLYFQEPGLPLA